MFRKILVAVDGSDMTGKVLSAAADVSRHYSSDLHLVYVSERGCSGGGTGKELVMGELPEGREGHGLRICKETRGRRCPCRHPPETGPPW